MAPVVRRRANGGRRGLVFRHDRLGDRPDGLLGVEYNFVSPRPMTFDNLLLEHDGPVAILTINRPTVLNAANTARIGQPEINLGIIPGYAGSQRLPRLLGKGVALDLLLTGRQVKADEALAIGLVNRVVPAAELMIAAKALAQELATKAPVAMQYIIEAVNRGLEISFDKAQVHEATLFGLVASTQDMREGTRAFLEKRKAQFKGE